jgi:hypothetical protein
MAFELGDLRKVTTNELLEHFSCVVNGWLRNLIPSRMSGRIDPEQLHNDVLFDFSQRLKAIEWNNLGYVDLRSICRTITQHKVFDALEYETRLKRTLNCAYAIGSRINVEFVADNRCDCNPECDFEHEDFIAMIRRGLPSNHREVYDLKIAGWSNQEVARELRVNIRTVQTRIAFIIVATRGELDKIQRPLQQRTTNNEQRTTNKRTLPEFILIENPHFICFQRRH